MARIRSIKPEFYTSEQVANLTPIARLLFIGLWTFCDDGGRHPASLKRLKMEVFPGDTFTDDDMAGWMGELIDGGLVREYEASGKRYWQVTGWRHQRIDRPTYLHPKPPTNDEDSSSPRRTIDEASSNAPRSVVEPSPPESSREESSREESSREESSREESSREREKSKSEGVAFSELLAVCRRWNQFADRGLVAARVRADKPSKAVKKAWQRVQRDKELRELLANLDAIETAIVSSSFVRTANWFRLERLLGGKNQDGETIVKKLLENGYRDDNRNRKTPMPVGPGQRHPDDASGQIGTF